MSPLTSRHTKCVIHCRVSTAKQAYEGESLDTQEMVCRNFAASKGWVIACPPWREAYSWRKDEHSAFEDILAYLKEHRGEVQYYIFRSIDRFTRAGSIVYGDMKRALAKHGVEMIDTFGIIQPTINTLEHLGVEYSFSRITPSLVSEMVAAAAANAEVSTILTRLVGQQIALTREGYKMGQPPDGFINRRTKVDGKKRVLQEPDPDRAKYIIAMFELRAKGQYSDEEICYRINAMGYLSKARQRWDRERGKVIGHTRPHKLTPKRLQYLIQLTLYCGIMQGRWTSGKVIRAKSPGLVSIDLWNSANRGKIFIHEKPDFSLEILYDQKLERIRRRYSRNDATFPFRHVVVCETCRKPLKGSSPRGQSGARFPIYHCARKHKYFGVKKAELDTALISLVGRIRYRPEAIESTIQKLNGAFSQQVEAVAAQAKAAQEQIAQLELEKTEFALAYSRASSDVMRQSLEAQMDATQARIEACRDVGTEGVTAADFADFLADVRSVMELPDLLLGPCENPDEMRALYLLVFQELPTFQNLSGGTAKLHWFLYLFSSFDEAKSHIVRNARLEWNHVEPAFHSWKRNWHLIRRALRSPRSPLHLSAGTNDNDPLLKGAH
jgi:DNA invertase Pin-like site-specific DNA recombinase